MVCLGHYQKRMEKKDWDGKKLIAECINDQVTSFSNGAQSPCGALEDCRHILELWYPKGKEASLFIHQIPSVNVRGCSYGY